VKTFARSEILPSWWANALDGFLQPLVSNFVLRRVAGSPTSVEVPAAAGEGRAALAIDNLWRFRDTTVQRAHPGGAAGTYIVWATTGPNVIVNTPAPNTDTTNYSFDLAITASGATPAVVAGVTEFWRQVGTVEWDGTSIVSVAPSVGDPMAEALDALCPIGTLVSYAGTVDPPGGRWLLADGRLISRTTPGGAAFFARAAHAYNGGVDPGSNQVRIPDKRGRVSVGADTMGTAQGAASRLPNSNRARGQNGGEERHTLALGEAPSHSHSGSGTTGIENSGLQHSHANSSWAIIASGGGGGAALPDFVFGVNTLTFRNAGNLFISSVDGPPAHTHNFSVATNAQGGGSAFNVLQPYEVDNVIVRVF
jgi:microcystin-dependent protein